MRNNGGQRIPGVQRDLDWKATSISINGSFPVLERVLVN